MGGPSSIFNQSQSKMSIYVRTYVHSVGRFRTFVRSGIDADGTQMKKLAFHLSMAG